VALLAETSLDVLGAVGGSGGPDDEGHFIFGHAVVLFQVAHRRDRVHAVALGELSADSVAEINQPQIASRKRDAVLVESVQVSGVVGRIGPTMAQRWKPLVRCR
jgi:hypothetical protein